ncbi:MAG TPA: hypothetical protein ENK53_05595 [Thiotrichales bacterium]|nr:hypothetical protein [Thiotrichales bacterium]
MIRLNDKTLLTSTPERLFVEAGGIDPGKTLNQDQLSTALGNTITALADRRSPLLLKLYEQARSAGDLPADPEIEQLADTLL